MRASRFWCGMVLAAMVAASAAAAPRGDAGRGAKLATVLGCHDCHGAGLTGKPVIDDPTIAKLNSSNLTRAVPRYTDRELARVLQRGVRPDGSHLWYMDAAPYAVMSPADLRDLIAYLRSVPPEGADQPRLVIGPRMLKAVQAGRFKPESATLAHDLAHPPFDGGPRLARGRYLARTACAGCHTPSLGGVKDPQAGDPPDLNVAAAYSQAEFRTMMRAGKGPGDRDLGDMTKAVQARFAAMPIADVDALHDYLSARAKAAGQ
ncbi:c-type cytochrome [Glacieibacterium frigidum]|nr:c-type cytochrome [Glacieibacterium frigidum]